MSKTVHPRSVSGFIRLSGEVVLETFGVYYGLLVRLTGRLAAQVIVLTAVIWCLFLVFPRLDLAVSGWFAAETGGFPLGDVPWLQDLRQLSSVLTFLIAGTAVGALATATFFGPVRWLLLRPSQALFVIAVYAIGPGLIVNSLLKSYYGRARPRDIIEFGGAANFTPVWQLAEECARNCSFSSGEAASAAAMLALIPVVAPARRPLAALLIAPFVLIFSVNRILFGGHFLSDVLFSWMIVALLIAVLASLMLTSARMKTIDEAIAQRRWPALIRPALQRAWTKRIFKAKTENTAAKT